MNYSLRKLSRTFYADYPHEQFPELLQKKNRPFVVLLIQIDSNCFAIPLRTNITHHACYRFRNSKRKTVKGTGLDFSKAIVVSDEKYLGEYTTIDNNEYKELDSQFHEIYKRFQRYVNNYKKFVRNPNEVFRKNDYRYSSLMYFHEELGL